MAGRPLFTSSSGIEYRWVDEGDHKVILASQDTEAMLDRNKAMATHNDGYTQDRTMRRAASIPMIVALKWLNEEGWWFMDAAKDPDVAKKLKAKLNSSDWRYLRTAPGVL